MRTGFYNVVEYEILDDDEDELEETWYYEDERAWWLLCYDLFFGLSWCASQPTTKGNYLWTVILFSWPCSSFLINHLVLIWLFLAIFVIFCIFYLIASIFKWFSFNSIPCFWSGKWASKMNKIKNNKIIPYRNAYCTCINTMVLGIVIFRLYILQDEYSYSYHIHKIWFLWYLGTKPAKKFIKFGTRLVSQNFDIGPTLV